MIEYPVYIPTRGRPTRQITAKALVELGIRPRLVVEAAEEEAYKTANPDCDVIVWPQVYADEYEHTPELNPHPTTGYAHNYAWDHARAEGHDRHWIMDDNIYYIIVRQNGERKRARDTSPLEWVETWAKKWVNLAGVSLAMAPFMSGKTVGLNTRLYCATLYRNDLDQYGIRWRRGLNDDTIVSLDILSTGYWCTAEIRAVGIKKVGTATTGRIKGGMTDFYAEGGFLRKSAEVVRLYPDLCHTKVRFHRIHHVCDYSVFKQQLIPVERDYTPVSGGDTLGERRTPTKQT